jgi:arginine decarboxylase
VIPTHIFLTKGVGKHRDKLTSFEMALRDARIAEFNLVRVSSIFPPHCKILTRSAGLRKLSPGEIVYFVISEAATDEPHRLIAASVGIAIPAERSLQHGYLSEFHAYGMTEQQAGDYAEDLAATMLATTLGVEFDPDRSFDEKKEIWKISGRIYKTMSITQSAVGAKGGQWTTVIAAAVFCAYEKG